LAAEMFKPFMFVMVFVMVGLFCIASLGRILASNSQANEEYLEGYEVIGGLAYTIWDPELGVNVTAIYEYDDDWHVSSSDSDAENPPYYHMPSPESASFSNPDSGSSTSDVKIWVVRNNTPPWNANTISIWKSKYPTGDRIQDFLYLRQGHKEGWLHPTLLRYDVAVIPFAKIIANYQADSNMSIIPLDLKHNITVFLTAWGPGNFTENLYNNSFCLGMAVQYGTEEVKKASMWTILGQMLTLQLPGVHPAINFIIAAPFWTAIAYVAVEFVRSFIPFLGG